MLEQLSEQEMPEIDTAVWLCMKTGRVPAPRCERLDTEARTLHAHIQRMAVRSSIQTFKSSFIEPACFFVPRVEIWELCVGTFRNSLSSPAALHEPLRFLIRYAEAAPFLEALPGARGLSVGLLGQSFGNPRSVIRNDSDQAERCTLHLASRSALANQRKARG